VDGSRRVPDLRCRRYPRLPWRLRDISPVPGICRDARAVCLNWRLHRPRPRQPGVVETVRELQLGALRKLCVSRNHEDLLLTALGDGDPWSLA